MKILFEVNKEKLSSLNASTAEIVRAYHQSLFEHRELLDDDAYLAEQHFLDYIKRGDVEGLKILSTQISSNFMVPQFSANKLKQAQYMMCVSITLLTRAAIEGGLQTTAALRLSDVYMSKVDNFTSHTEMPPLLFVAAMDFAFKVKEANTLPIDKPIIQKCRVYIFDHLHCKIKLNDIAVYCGVTPQYLSGRFKKETGYSITQLIRDEKLKTSMTMLENTNYSISEIAYYLAFPSHSNFSATFTKHYKVAPKMYRTLHCKYK